MLGEVIIDFDILGLTDLNNYMINDYLLPVFSDGDYNGQFGSNRWLKESKQKRMVFDRVYGDLLIAQEKRLNILDIGGGINLAQKRITKHNNLTIIDLLSHDAADAAKSFCDENNINLICDDWYARKNMFEEFDLIVAVDLFPNVDQRFEAFMATLADAKVKFRLLLTYYNKPRFYNVKRIDADEYMCLSAWSGANIVNTMTSLGFDDWKKDINKIAVDKKSIYPNGRGISYFYNETDILSSPT